MGAQQPMGGYSMRSSSALGCGSGGISSTSCMMRSTKPCFCTHQADMLTVRLCNHHNSLCHSVCLRGQALQLPGDQNSVEPVKLGLFGNIGILS